MTARNWAGNVTFAARRVLGPTSVAALQAMVADSTRLRALGSGHSFCDIADTTGDHVSLADLPPTISVTPESATVAAGLRYGDVAPALHAAGVALRNLGSLPHIGIAGACATGTHGSGVRVGSLASAVAALDLVLADGTRLSVRRGDPTFPAHVVALGALGVVTALTLDVVPTFSVSQYVYEGVPMADLLGSLDQVLGAAYSVSVFTDWAGTASVWQKCVAGEAPLPVGRPATVPRHPIPSVAADACTEQLGVPGPWHERLPHFRLDFTPSSGDELQSEFFVPRASAVDALRALVPLGPVLNPVVQISELRTVAADDLWLSPCYDRDSLAIHFTWVNSWGAVAPVLAAVESALAPFEARPHWGKLFGHTAGSLAALYPRLPEFVALMASLDPTGTFRNAYLDRLLPAHTG